MLLMKAPDTRPAPPEIERIVAHGSVAAVDVVQGQLLTVTDIEGGRAAQLYAYTKADLGEFLSPHHTRVFSNSYLLNLGMRLVTNRRRPIMVLGKDSVRGHDLLLPGSTSGSLRAAGIHGETGGREAFRTAIAAQGLAPIKVPDPVNLFLNVGIGMDGSIKPRPPGHGAGGYVTLRVLIDCTVFVGACASDLDAAQARGPIAVSVRNQL
ncbi:MAG: hypothetical protein JWR51_2956 [Devosia sp.]|uniref:urea carboxylase-associated family protein n=1 Tax=Devosia sp. TaxID=1871048 RepID=UPI00262DDDDF|nr:urea carboxylase-associated family protein [Devosia sp.]MDB5529853.1 hypothetical protein [Devosia sp.]